MTVPEPQQGSASSAAEACLPYFQQRAQSSLKIKDDAWQRFLGSEHRCARCGPQGSRPALQAPTSPLPSARRAALTGFIEDEKTTRVLFYLDGRDLVAVRAAGSH